MAGKSLVFPGRGKASGACKGKELNHPEKDGSEEIHSDGVDFGSAKISADVGIEVSRPPAAPSPARGSNQWKPGDTVLKDYLVEGELGEGGMGKVYLVSSLSTRERFAVKRVKIGGDGSDAARRNFMSELQTWIDLPVHPNLAACRFFRSVGDEIVIFAEYLEGGSLDRWIKNGHGPLYKGEPDDVLARILDIAIQSAWGLHALHEWGLTHQDMKPGNVLLSAGGSQVKVCDFGIARLRSTGNSLPGWDVETSYAKYGGRTNAFCSPEQKQGGQLSRKTDVWSWGLSVLQMFTGTVSWEWGCQADQVLQSTLRKSERDSRIPAIPPEVGEILGKCFHQEPVMRWSSLFEAAEALRRLIVEASGKDLFRHVPAFPRRNESRDSDLIVQTLGERIWEDPHLWLREAFSVAGLVTAEAEKISLPRSGSRESQAICDLAAYEELVRIVTELAGSRARGFESDLACIYTNKALVHEFLNDLPGALNSYDEAIKIRRWLVEVEGRRVFLSDLAGTYNNKALVLDSLGDLGSAVVFHDQAIRVYEQLVKVEKKWEFANDLARSYVNKANVLYSLGEFQLSIALADKAIDIREQLVKHEEKWDLANELAVTYQSKANALYSLGEFQSSIALLDQAIQIRERLIEEEGKWELARYLALTYQNKSAVLCSMGEARSSITLCDRVIEIYEQLVRVKGKRELANDLANAYHNKATGLQYLGELRSSIALFDQAIAIRERLVTKKGRWELAEQLAMTYLNKALAHLSLGEKDQALALCSQAIEIREGLVEGGRVELRGGLAKLKVFKAACLLALGATEEAQSLVCQAISVLEEEVARTGRADLNESLQWAKDTLKDIP